MKYCIYAIVNTVNGGVYIGSSSRGAEYRWQRHRKDRYGEASFRMNVLEEVADPGCLLQREQAYLDDRRASFPPHLNYNVCWVAGNRTGYKYTAEQRKRLSESHMGIGKTPETICKQVATWSAKLPPREIIDPDGNRHVVMNVRDFARQHGLTCTALGRVLRGLVRQHKGWHLSGTDIRPREYRLLDPDGNLIIHVGELKAFCVARGLPYKSVHAVCSGQMKVCRGWRLAS
jgi:hypothetical protein